MFPEKKEKKKKKKCPRIQRESGRTPSLKVGFDYVVIFRALTVISSVNMVQVSGISIKATAIWFQPVGNMCGISFRTV